MADRTNEAENDSGGVKDGSGGVEEVRTSPWSWLAPMLTFLAGLLLGVVVVAAGNLGEDSNGDTAQPSPTPSATPTDEPTTGLVARVPQSCLDIADEATAAREQVEEAATAARDLDARLLSESLDSLQQVQQRVQALAEECRNQASIAVPSAS